MKLMIPPFLLAFLGFSLVHGEPASNGAGFRPLQRGKCIASMGGPTSQLFRTAKSGILTEPSEFEGFWVKWRSLGAPMLGDAAVQRKAMLKSLPKVDFSKEVVVFVVGRSSERPTHRIEVSKVVRSGNGAVVECREHQGQITGAATQPSRPYQFVAIPKAPKEKVQIKIDFVRAPKLQGPLPPMAPPPMAPPPAPGGPLRK